MPRYKNRRYLHRGLLGALAPGVAKLPATCRRVALIGFILYALSWVTPSLDGAHLGAWAFGRALTMGLQLAIRSDSLMGMLAGLSLLCGWLANFSILFRWHVSVRLLWIVAPWVPFVVLLINHGFAPSPVSLLYFYPWAAGIGLIHLASVVAERCDGPSSSSSPRGAK